MNKNTENIDRYLKDVELPEHVSHQHRQKLRREVLREIERRQNMSVRKISWKYAAVLAVVIGVGAISVVGVNIGRYYYKGKNDAGVHVFYSEDLETVVTLGDDEVTDVEQTRRDLEEIELLRQQDKRELLKVREATIGTSRIRAHEYRYQLSDGRTKDMKECAEYNAEQRQEFSAQLEEFRRLQKAGPGEDLGTYEETVEGRAFSFKRDKYFLSDGTEIIWSVGTPKDDQ
jgi:hypothetical protein